MTSEELIEKTTSRLPDKVRGLGVKKNASAVASKQRDIANSLLQFEPFFEWAGDLMVRIGFFGEGRELTPYQQGCRGKIVQEIEKLLEASDVGADFMARVFKEKVCAKSTKSTERN